MTDNTPTHVDASVRTTDTDRVYTLLLEELATFLKKSPEEIDIDKTFDEYSLDSIDGVLMTGAIGDRLDIDLPPELLMQYRKVSDAFAAIATLAGVKTQDAAKPTRQPLYLLAGGAGRDGRLATLAQRCIDKVEGTFIPWGNWHEWLDAGGQLKTIVDACCNRITALSPEGPLQLAGYSQGGQLSFAVAAELTKRGRTVSLLVMIDSPVKGRGKQLGMVSYLKRNRDSILKLALRRIRRSPTTYAADFGEETISRLSEIVRLHPKHVSYLHNWISEHLSERDSIILDNYVQMQYFNVIWEKWVDNLQQPLPAYVHTWLLRSEDEGSTDLGWSELCRNLNIREVKGTHHSMFDGENIDDLANAFVTIVATNESSSVISEAEATLLDSTLS